MEISKFKSQLLVAYEQVKASRRRVQSVLVKLRWSIPGTLQSLLETLRSVENILRKALRNSHDAIVVMDHGSRKFRLQLSNSFELGAEHLRQAQNGFARLRRSVAERLQRLREVLRSAENGLRKTAGSFRDASVEMKRGIRKLGSQLSSAFEQEASRLRRAQSALGGLVNRVIEKPRRLRQELDARENELRELVASSLDAVVVTNDNHRLVAANPKALELLGVSEKNLGSFSLGVFFLHGPNLGFDGTGSPFINRRETRGKCKIRRLDGSLQLAECVFVANFVPFRNLCRFYDVTPQECQAHICHKVQAGPRQYVNAQPRGAHSDNNPRPFQNVTIQV